MKPRALGLVAAVLAALLSPVAAASKDPKPKPVAAADRKAGMEVAPGLIQEMGLSCQLSDARKVGEGTDPKTKKTTTYYEVACSNSPGLLISVVKGGANSTFSCLESAATLPCALPGNIDTKAQLVPLLQKAKVQCTPAQARAIGQTPTNSFLEVACAEGPGYIVIAGSPLDVAKPVEAQNCLAYDDADSNVKCTLSDKAKRIAVLDKYAAAANNGCVVKERRFVGSTKDGADFYEASCENGKGYIYKVASDKLAEAYDCGRAQQILGGCTLTDARQAATEQAGLYTRLAKASGSSCDVDTYAVFPSTGSTEVVELVCKNGPGGIGFFQAGGKGSVLSCNRALVAGYKCGLNKTQGYADLTADLQKNNVKSCQVSASRVVGRTPKGTTLLEVACADGLKGYMIEYSAAPEVNAIAATGCAFAAGCKLPGNT